MNLQGAVPAKGLSLSVFLKCGLILSLATAVVAGVIAITSDRAIRDVASNGLRQLAKDVTGYQAATLSGAVRFRKKTDVQEALDYFVGNEADRVTGAIVLAADGEVLGQSGRISSAEATQLMTLAEAAIATGVAEKTKDGFWRASPVLSGDGAVGSLAIAWSPDPMFAQIDAQRRNQLLMAGGVFALLTVASGLFLRQTLAVPLRKLAKRTIGMADGDLNSAVPNVDMRDEIGQTAEQLELLREKLFSAEASRVDAQFQSAGFQGASVPLVMTDTHFTVTHANRAFEHLVSSKPEFAQLVRERPESTIFGGVLSPMAVDPDAFAEMNVSKLPFATDVHFQDETYHVTLNSVCDDHGKQTGFVMEWVDVNDTRITEAVLDSLDTAQLRADFDGNGRLKAVNKLLAGMVPSMVNQSKESHLHDVLRLEAGQSLSTLLTDGKSHFDVFHIGSNGMASGIVTPVQNAKGKVTGYVFLGHDITESELARVRAEQRREALERDQRTVVEELSTGLSALAEGNLTVRIKDTFPEDHEKLRQHFNSSLDAMEEAVTVVRDNSANILGEAGNISDAADNLSKRTEQQAATLEEFAASLTELTASVAATADGADQASEVVQSARANAETSGTVVKEAVQAMGEISESSERISRIISVIDDIAFQTNLLALNAGVEAARAGDAGRGFAVVASEVRALAQRSSEAASEINDLISSSSNQVKKGVSLVGRAGEALETIVASIGGIADHVTSIAASAREQSTGIDEINAAMSQLDQATQQNVAMFEETTAATHTLRSEASALVAASNQFSVAKPLNSEKKDQVSPAASLPARHSASSLAVLKSSVAAAPVEEEEDWEDF